MNIDDVEKQLTGVDKVLTTMENIWKKHWKIILILLILTGVYFVYEDYITEDVDVDNTEQGIEE